MNMREIMKRAHKAQIQAGKCIPLQLALFPPRVVLPDETFITHRDTGDETDREEN